MRRCVWLCVLVLAVAVPAFAQFDDLIKQAETLQIAQDIKVTLDLRRVPAKDAVAKLAEATQAPLVCSDVLAGRLVSLIAHDQSAKQAGSALARALRAKWVKKEQTLSLEPCEPLAVLTPAELASELQAAFLNSNVPTGYQARQAERQILQNLSGAQIQALMSPQGMTGEQFTPQQRQQIALLIGSRVASSLQGLPREYGMADAADGMSVRVMKRGTMEFLVISGGPGRMMTLPMQGGRDGAPPVSIRAEPVMR